MRISAEFSKNAISYNNHNIIQDIIAKKVVQNIEYQPKTILDLGCGSGAVYKHISWSISKIRGIDFAQGMLDIHPKSNNIELKYGSFNDKLFFSCELENSYDYIVSASALQWADDLDFIFEELSKSKTKLSFAIFTSGTFKTLNQTANLQSILRGSDEVELLAKKYLTCRCEKVNYKLEFDSTRDIFKYIKKSGVSASRSVLTYKESRKLLKEYPISYLEFEVLYIVT